jgi:tRNA(Ile)-lysidine synthase
MAATSRSPIPEVRRHDLVAELSRRLSGRCGVPEGARLVVAVSGGPDSTALLLGALALRERWAGSGHAALDPVAAHVNHHLRQAADADEAFVAGLCRDLEVPLRVRHVHPGRDPGSTAANARRRRYDALADAAAEIGAAHVAVAHHAQDQLETMLMALGRGCGIDALSGMPWRRPLADGVQLVRPLLQVSRASCESMCAAAGVQWRRDPTNADPATVRGRLRRDVIDALEALWPSAALGASLAADDVAAAREALDRLLAEAFGEPAVVRWERARLRALPVPVIAAGLRRAAAAITGAACGRAQLLPVAEAIRDDERRPRAWDWPGGLRARVTAKEVRIDRVR